jgi:hypothetical protein
MVSKYDPNPIQPHKSAERKMLRRDNFYNVWGFRDASMLKPTAGAEDYYGVVISHNFWVAVMFC